MMYSKTMVKINEGDIVRVNRGKVEYTVTDATLRADHLVQLKSNNTGRISEVEAGKLVPVTLSDRELVDTEAQVTPEETPVKETSAYQKAVLFALNKLGKHVYAGTVRSNVKAKRRALNSRQKASRKANR